MATNSAWTAVDAPPQITATEHDLSGIAATVKQLDGKSDSQLRNLYADALREESNAKQDLYMLRKRIANLGTDIETDEEVLLKSAKQRVASGISYIRALEVKLKGKPVPPTTK